MCISVYKLKHCNKIPILLILRVLLNKMWHVSVLQNVFFLSWICILIRTLLLWFQLLHPYSRRDETRTNAFQRKLPAWKFHDIILFSRKYSLWRHISSGTNNSQLFTDKLPDKVSYPASCAVSIYTNVCNGGIHCEYASLAKSVLIRFPSTAELSPFWQ